MAACHGLFGRHHSAGHLLGQPVLRGWSLSTAWLGDVVKSWVVVEVFVELGRPREGQLCSVPHSVLCSAQTQSTSSSTYKKP